MTESPIDLSRPSPPSLIPIRCLMAEGVVSRRNFNKTVPNRVTGSKVEPRVDTAVEQDGHRPCTPGHVHKRLRAPILMAVQAERKVLRVCVNNNSIPPSSSPARMKAIATALSVERTSALSEPTSRLANLGRSYSMPNVAQSAREACPRRKAVSEERVTEADSEIDNRPTKRRRHEIEPMEHKNNEVITPDANWQNPLCRKNMSGRHVRSGTGAAPATLKSLRDKILRKRLPAAGDVC